MIATTPDPRSILAYAKEHLVSQLMAMNGGDAETRRVLMAMDIEQLEAMWAETMEDL